MAKSSPQASSNDLSTEVIPAIPTGIQQYLDKAVGALKKFGVATSKEPTELVKMLDEVKYVDEAKILAIAKTIQHMSSFNQLVRDNVESINIGTRYLEITQMFDSIREDSKMLIRQLDDGKFSFPEKAQNLWMRIRRGTPSARFDKIADVYKSVSADTKNQLDREVAIMDAYIDFRFALKEAEVLAREVLDEHTPSLLKSQEALTAAQEAVTAADKAEPGKRSKLELVRDEARHAFEKEDRTYQLLKDVAENLSVGYDVGETLVTKLKQTHDVKDQVYRRSVTFFTTNEHVFTILGTVYTSQQGLNEATKSTEAMKEGVNKGLEDVAELGRELERAAIKAGYGSTIRPESVEKLVTAISDYQIESIQMIAELRKESEQSTQEIRRVVEEGKKRFQETVIKFDSPTTGRLTEKTT